jgi:Ca2+-binding RTX toxin-like protein
MALVIGTNNIFFSETLDAADGVTGAADSVFGLGGSDHIFGLGGDDWLFGGDGEDHLSGNVGGDHLYGGDDRDLLYGDDGEDDLHGDDGHDVLLGGDDGDTLDGGEGHDLAYYTDSVEAVHISLAGNTAWGGTAEGDTLSNIEDLAGSIFDDELEGDDEDNWLHGNFGDDTLTGGANGFGGDWLIGGYGIDTASYEHSPQGVRVSLLDDTAFFGHAEGDELDEIENLTGSAYADLLVGDNDANELTGLGGADTLDGGGGADTMIGGTGDDHYYVDDAGDVVTEYAFGGFDDTVNAGISYTLDVTVETWCYSAPPPKGPAINKTTGSPAMIGTTCCAAAAAPTPSTAATAPTRCSAAPATIPTRSTTRPTRRGNFATKAPTRSMPRSAMSSAPRWKT